MVITRTPFRISFFGGGTDYPVWYREHGGAVLSATIDKYCYITTRYLPPFFDCKYRIRYGRQEEVNTLADIQHPSVRECLSHLAFNQGIEMQHNTDVPGMSGIGSSSAFTVGFLNSLYALEGKTISKDALARSAIHIEQNMIKENVGSQDQAAAAFGGLNKIYFGGSDELRVEPVDISQESMRVFHGRLMLFFTGYPRNASEIAAEQIKMTPQKASELTRMRAMVDEAYEILKGRPESIDDFGKLLHEGWLIKRSLTSKISTSAIDTMYADARSAGAVGGKLLGAGGGGFMLLFVRPEDQSRVRAKLGQYLHVPFRFENLGSAVIYSMNPDSEQFLA